jgi:hypothetical protein
VVPISLKSGVFICLGSDILTCENAPNQGCQMVSFQTKNPNLGKFWRALDGKMLIYFMALWNILYRDSGYFVAIWYILYTFGTLFPVLV